MGGKKKALNFIFTVQVLARPPFNDAHSSRGLIPEQLERKRSEEDVFPFKCIKVTVLLYIFEGQCLTPLGFSKSTLDSRGGTLTHPSGEKSKGVLVWGGAIT